MFEGEVRKRMIRNHIHMRFHIFVRFILIILDDPSAVQIQPIFFSP